MTNACPGLIGLFMQHAPFSRVRVLAPDLLDMDQRALARAEEIMLERGKRDGFVGLGHVQRHLNMLGDFNASRNCRMVDHYVVVAVKARRKFLTHRFAFDVDRVEQFVSGRIA